MKILVFGPFNSGKSTFVSKACHGSSMSIDKSGTTIALDHGTVQMFSIPLYIFGTPGLERFEVLRKILSKGADGCVMVIDAVNPASIDEAKTLYTAFENYLPKKTPIVIAANKQDLPDARKPDVILKALGLEKNEDIVGIIPTSAATGEGIEKTVKMVVLAVLSRYLYFLKAIRDGGQKGIKGIRENLATDIDEERVISTILWMGWRGLVKGDWTNDKFSLPKRIAEIVDILELTTINKS